jgi:DME family drug/metabolite transporter
LTQQDDLLTLTTVTMGFAALVLIPAGTVPVVLADGVTWTGNARSWLLFAYLGAVTMALAYALLYAGLRTTSSRTAVVATLVEPVTALLLAALVLEEGLKLSGIVGRC